ncbi:MAG: hypothetical protein APF80_02100 [Alphaproteobacteria bacterium BRH_c36]|nr:MAG: hypothetical protein APF80_02100 [Alphaproteobacteria bacterium BRH_c36]
MAVTFALQMGFECLYTPVEVTGLNGLSMGRAAKDLAKHVNFAEDTFSKFQGNMRMAYECPVGACNVACLIGFRPKN